MGEIIMLISEMRDEIIVEIGGDSSDTTLLANILQFIRTGLRRFPLISKQRLLLTTKYASLSAGEQTLTMPTDFITERAVYYVSSGKRKRITKQYTNDFNDSFNSDASSDAISTYRIIDDYMEFSVKAETATTIYIEYYKEVDDVDLTDTFFGSSAMAEITKDFAKYSYFMYEEDENKAQHFLALGSGGLRELDAQKLEEELPEYVGEA